MLDWIPYVLGGVYWTFGLALGGLGLGFLIGIGLATGRRYGASWLKVPIDAYTWFFRSTPLLVLLFLFYWGVFPALHFKLSTLVCSVVVLGLYSSAFQCEIFRGALKSVSDGQLMAASSLGMSKWRGIYHVVLPQALRMVIPAWANQYAGILKDTSYCYALGVVELMTRTSNISVGMADPLTPFLFTGALYIVFTYVGTFALGVIYKRSQIPGLIGGK